jgi:hypothetical protein
LPGEEASSYPILDNGGGQVESTVDLNPGQIRLFLASA